jgi:hypothetical protein
MTLFEWIATGVIILIIAANCFLIWYEECVTEYVDREEEEGQEDVNILYIKDQMNKENINQKINPSKN